MATVTWLTNFYEAMAEERMRRFEDDERRDCLLVREAKRVQAERLAAFAGREFYEKGARDER